MIQASGITLTDADLKNMAAADFGLSRLETEGVQIATLIQTERLAVKVLVLFPNQTEPEHRHPPVGDDPGKEETIRAISGNLRFYIPGKDTIKEGFIPEGKEDCYTVRHEVIMKPGDQLTLAPGQKHWFQAGPEGAVMYSFSTCVRDILDGFTDPNIKRETIIKD
jgi:D-lyxose ketol-isomerase